MAQSKGALHEEVRHGDELQVGSDRNFAFVMAAFFALVGWRTQALPHFVMLPFRLIGWLMGEHFSFVLRFDEAALRHEGTIRIVFWSISGLFLLLALVAPKVLNPLNVAWMKFGLVLQKIISPIVLGVLFYVGVTPIGLIMRMTGKDLLRLKLDKSARSYWIVREPPGPAPDTMRNQF